MRYILPIILFIALFICPMVALANIDAYSKVSANRVSQNETIDLEIVINGASQVEPPTIKGLENFKLINNSTSQSVEIVNGQITRSNRFIYSLSPIRAGTYKIGESDIVADGQVIHVSGQTVTVVSRTGGLSAPLIPQPGYQPPSYPSYPSYPPAPPALPVENVKEQAPGLILQAKVDNESPYVNEQIIYKVILYQRASLREANIEYPDFKNFISQQLDETQSYEATINGQVYTAQEMSFALFPTKTGKIIIPSARLIGKAVYYDQDIDRIFGNYDVQPIDIISNPIIIYAKKLPPAPANYTNAVGTFNINTQISKVKLKAGETAKLKIVLYGRGNLNSILTPKLRLGREFEKNFKIYPNSPETQIVNKTDYIYGQKVFKYDIVPLKPGNYMVPPIRFVTFNPKNRNYDTLKSDNIPLKVLPGNTNEQLSMTKPTENQQEDRAIDMQDLLGLHTNLAALNNHSLSTQNYILLGFIFLIPLILITLSYLVLSQKERQKDNLPQYRRKQAYSKAKKRLNKLTLLLKDDKTKEYYSELDNIIKDYIADKFNIAGGTLTSADIEELFKDKKISTKITVYITEILKLCELSEFSTSQDTHTKGDVSYKDTVKVLKMLDKELKKCL